MRTKRSLMAIALGAPLVSQGATSSADETRLLPNLGGSSNGQKVETTLSDVLLPLSAPSAPQPRPSRLIRAPTRSSRVREWMCCDREGGVLDRESANKVVDHWRS